jgi:acylphosphatase
MKVRAHLFISGRVQGVFFRDSTRKEALKRGITGWVRNLPDGRVEAVFEGDKEMVEDMIRWCHRGPEMAKVISVKVIWENYIGEFSNFRIVR